MAFWIAAVLAPFVAGLQRYAVTYGYGGVSRSEARKNAKDGFVAGALFSALFIAAKLAE